LPLSGTTNNYQARARRSSRTAVHSHHGDGADPAQPVAPTSLRRHGSSPFPNAVGPFPVSDLRAGHKGAAPSPNAGNTAAVRLMQRAAEDFPELSDLRMTAMPVMGERGGTSFAAAPAPAPLHLTSAAAIGAGDTPFAGVGAARGPPPPEIVAGCRGLAPAPRSGLLPDGESVIALAAGEMHTLCLCGASRYSTVP
jgi:hypothetical protein